MKSRISGKEATKVAQDMATRGPIRLVTPDGLQEEQSASLPPVVSEHGQKAPPRVRKPSSANDQCLAATPDLESHRKRLREAFGNTMSDEFVDVILGKLLEALRPSPFDRLEEPTINAALAVISSMQPQSELEALLAVHDGAAALGVSVESQKARHRVRSVPKMQAARLDRRCTAPVRIP